LSICELLQRRVELIGKNCKFEARSKRAAMDRT
jgi:hypothetical protein